MINEYTKDNCEIFEYVHNFLNAPNNKTFDTLLLESNYPKDTIFNIIRNELKNVNLLDKIPSQKLFFNLEPCEMHLNISLSEIVEDIIAIQPDNLLLEYLFKIFRAVSIHELNKVDTDGKSLSYRYLCRALKCFQSFVNEYDVIYLILNYFPNIKCRRSAQLDMKQHVDFQVIRDGITYNIWIYACSDFAIINTIKKIQSKNLVKGIHILLPGSNLDLIESKNNWQVYSIKALELLDKYMQLNAKKVDYNKFFSNDAKQLCSYIRSFEFYG